VEAVAGRLHHRHHDRVGAESPWARASRTAQRDVSAASAGTAAAGWPTTGGADWDRRFGFGFRLREFDLEPYGESPGVRNASCGPTGTTARLSAPPSLCIPRALLPRRSVVQSYAAGCPSRKAAKSPLRPLGESRKPSADRPCLGEPPCTGST
jgi:hypothetical protein